jgi:excisionase family DNA binding protein
MSFDISAAKEYVSIPELANQWVVTEQHVYNLVKRGDLPAYRIGRRLIVSKADAQNFLERNATALAAA